MEIPKSSLKDDYLLPELEEVEEIFEDDWSNQLGIPLNRQNEDDLT